MVMGLCVCWCVVACVCVVCCVLCVVCDYVQVCRCVVMWLCGCVVVWLCGRVVEWLCVWVFVCVCVLKIFRAGAHRAVAMALPHDSQHILCGSPSRLATGTAPRQPKYFVQEPIAPQPQALPHDSQNILCGSLSRRSHRHCLTTATIFRAGACRAVATGTAS
jgi:hypothetical protein